MEAPKNTQAQRWHPRISPYRLFVITTTIILGTAKTLGGSPTTPTTLEWIGSTLFSIFISGYDNYSPDRESTPPYWLEWLFVPDCMTPMWFLFSCFAIARPHYLSDEKALYQSRLQPPITTYRILVCSLVILFGMGKAVLSYQSIRASPWIDWVMAVPISTILYTLGLYEYNSANNFASFFFVDRTDILVSFVTGFLYILALFLCALWIYILAYTTTLFSYQPSIFAELFHTGIESVGTFWKILAHEFLLAGIMAGVVMFLLILRQAAKCMSDERGVVQRTCRMVRRVTLRAIRKPTASSSSPRHEKDDGDFGTMKGVPDKQTRILSRRSHHFSYFLDLMLYIFAHISTYMSGIALCLTLPLPGSPFFIGNVLTTLTSDPEPSPFGTGIVASTITWALRALGILFSVSFSLSMMIGMVLGAVVLIILMIEPFWPTRGGRTETLKERLIGLGPLEQLM